MLGVILNLGRFKIIKEFSDHFTSDKLSHLKTKFLLTVQQWASLMLIDSNGGVHKAAYDKLLKVGI
jgi:hypothetical protein